MNSECPYMDSSSDASIPFFGFEGRLLTYIRSLVTASRSGCRTIMGYSRANSQSLFRLLKPWTFAGSAGTGSTCWPSSGLLCNRRGLVPLLMRYGVACAGPTFTSQPVLVDTRFRSSSSPRRFVRSCLPTRPPRCCGDGFEQSE